MKELIAKKSWLGLEGHVFPGNEFTASSPEREKELIESGRAVYADESKESKESKEDKEVKGGSTPPEATGKSDETFETKAPKRKRRTKAQIEAEKEDK